MAEQTKHPRKKVKFTHRLDGSREESSSPNWDADFVALQDKMEKELAEVNVELAETQKQLVDARMKTRSDRTEIAFLKARNRKLNTELGQYREADRFQLETRPGLHDNVENPGHDVDTRNECWITDSDPESDSAEINQPEIQLGPPETVENSGHDADTRNECWITDSDSDSAETSKIEKMDRRIQELEQKAQQTAVPREEDLRSESARLISSMRVESKSITDSALSDLEAKISQLAKVNIESERELLRSEAKNLGTGIRADLKSITDSALSDTKAKISQLAKAKVESEKHHQLPKPAAGTFGGHLSGSNVSTPDPQTKKGSRSIDPETRRKTMKSVFKGSPLSVPGLVPDNSKPNTPSKRSSAGSPNGGPQKRNRVV
ncbi:hypothetical protein ACHAPU_006668 [Fusarium lateritium]